MSISDSEIERISSTIIQTCAASGGCAVYRNADNLTVCMGDEEIAWFTADDGRDEDYIRRKLREVLSK